MRNLFLSLVLSTAAIFPAIASQQMPLEQVDVKQLTAPEAAVVQFCNLQQLGFNWETIHVAGIDYRKGEVSGYENNCGIYSLNAVFPKISLTRENVLASLLEAIIDHSHEHHETVVTEIAKELVIFVRSGEVERYPPIKNNNWRDFVTDVRNDVNLDETDALCVQAKSSEEILGCFIDLLRNPDVLFLAQPQDKDCLGTLGLVCLLNNLNVMLVNADPKNNMHTTRTFDNDGELQTIFFRNNHFSPMCKLDDIKFRNHLATTYVNETIKKRYGYWTTQGGFNSLKGFKEMDAIVSGSQAKPPAAIKIPAAAPVKVPAPVKAPVTAPVKIPVPVKVSATAPAKVPAAVPANGPTPAPTKNKTVFGRKY